MRAYSMDIRERVMENLGQESMRKTAKRFRVSDYFVYRLKQRYREAGTLAPKPHGGGHGPLVDEAGGEFIRAVLAEASDSTLKSYVSGMRGDSLARSVNPRWTEHCGGWVLSEKKNLLRPPKKRGKCPKEKGRL